MSPNLETHKSSRDIDRLTLFLTFSYAGFEPLTNILLKRLRPSVFIPLIMVFWGICMTCMGLVHDFSGLAAARFFLGVAEAGLFPGVNCRTITLLIAKAIC